MQALHASCDVSIIAMKTPRRPGMLQRSKYKINRKLMTIFMEPISNSSEADDEAASCVVFAAYGWASGA
jgi:hypothetical protein